MFNSSPPLLTEEVAKGSFQCPIKRSKSDNERPPQQGIKRKTQRMTRIHQSQSDEQSRKNRSISSYF